MTDGTNLNQPSSLTDENKAAIADLLDGVDKMATTHNAQVRTRAKREALQIMAVALPLLFGLLLLL